MPRPFASLTNRLGAPTSASDTVHTPDTRRCVRPRARRCGAAAAGRRVREEEVLHASVLGCACGERGEEEPDLVQPDERDAVQLHGAHGGVEVRAGLCEGAADASAVGACELEDRSPRLDGVCAWCTRLSCGASENVSPECCQGLAGGL